MDLIFREKKLENQVGSTLSSSTKLGLNSKHKKMLMLMQSRKNLMTSS